MSTPSELQQDGLPYPPSWEVDVILKDGRAAHLRPIRPSDIPAVQLFHSRQSAESIYFRFFSAVNELSAADLRRFTHVDHQGRVGFVVTREEEIMGIGRYERLDAESAEVAFNISDAHQGRGLGTVLLEHLAAAARENGFSRFVAEVLPSNRKMLKVFRKAGYKIQSNLDDGIIFLEFDLDPTAETRQIMYEREHQAESIAMRAVLEPQSLVVVGASRHVGTLGHRLVSGVLDSNFTGELHIVHPDAEQIGGVNTVARVSDVPHGIDLALVAVPTAAIQGVIEECGDIGVKAIVLFTLEVAESSEGVNYAAQRDLVAMAHAHGMRIVGPATWGVINTREDIRLNASLAGRMPLAGGLALFNQSGALSQSVLAEAMRAGLGVASYVSAGLRADISGNDCMQYWTDDERTEVVGMYLESLGNPRKFSRVARRLSRSKPLLVLKPGSSGFGVPPGHAVRPSSAPPEAFDALLQASGAIRVRTLHQMMDTARFLINQPLLPAGGVAILGNRDALTSMLADACIGEGLDLAFEPVTVRPDATPDDFQKLAEDVASRPGVSVVLAAFVPDLVRASGGLTVDLVRGIVHQVCSARSMPAAVCAPDLGWSTVEIPLDSKDIIASPVPVYYTPEEAARVVRAVDAYSRWRSSEEGVEVARPDVRPRQARKLVKNWLAASDTPIGPEDELELDRDQAAELLACYGIKLWQGLPAPDVQTATAAAEHLGWPVVLKTTDPHLQHRLDLGGVRLDIQDAAELASALRSMRRQLGPGAGDNLVVQRMATPGETCVIRTLEDPLYGPVLSFNVGGSSNELSRDVAYGIPPMTETSIAQLIRSVRPSRKLLGYRGSKPVDINALEDVMARVSLLVNDLPFVRALELHPVLVSSEGAEVLGAQIIVTSPVRRADAERRALLGPVNMTGWQHG